MSLADGVYHIHVAIVCATLRPRWTIEQHVVAGQAFVGRVLA